MYRVTMYTNVYIFIILATMAALTSVFREYNNSRSPEESSRGNGTCVSLHVFCDGHRDCFNGADEACTVGLNKRSAAPNSTESQPSTCRVSQWQCKDGSCINLDGKCNDVVDCPDGSDETHALCRDRNNISTILNRPKRSTCGVSQWQCTDGSCINLDGKCNSVVDCPDGSDETQALCRDRQPGACVLPEFPEHGTYVVSGVPDAQPGMTIALVSMNYTCDKGYGIIGKNDNTCYNGSWFTAHPECVRFCQLKTHVSVEYKCVLSGESEGFRTCEEYEPKGTKVQPECRKPNYYSEETLRYMTCNDDGNWNYEAKCVPECGTVTPVGTELIFGGRRAKRGELPWQTAIYTKDYTPYMQICGGALISSTVVLSAAHCFWANNVQLPKERYAVALGKLYRPWMLKQDDDVQYTDIRDIHIPPYYMGSMGNFQHDIAVILLEKTIVYKPHVRPVCLNFDKEFEKTQLMDGRLGKVAGWGVQNELGEPSQVLKVVELPFVEVSKCIVQSPLDFRPYITGDKLCAGYANGTGLCKGDSGGGLSFPQLDKVMQRYYLRGIVSTAHASNDACNTFALTTFTNIMDHEDLIKQYWTLDEL